MMYTLIASGNTGQGGQLTDLWPAGSSGTRLCIQNQSGCPLAVLVHLPDVAGVAQAPLVWTLTERDTNIDETRVDATLAVSVRCTTDGASFTAVRMN